MWKWRMRLSWKGRPLLDVGLNRLFERILVPGAVAAVAYWLDTWEHFLGFVMAFFGILFLCSAAVRLVLLKYRRDRLIVFFAAVLNPIALLIGKAMLNPWIEFLQFGAWYISLLYLICVIIPPPRVHG